MHRGFIALGVTLALLAGCSGAREPHPYPESARAQFEATCPRESPMCQCMWDDMTRTLTHEEYEVALARFRETGLTDPRITRARTRCLERHPS